MGIIHYRYQLDPRVESADFRQMLEHIALDRFTYVKEFKDDGTTTVSLASLGDHHYIVKRYNTKNKLHLLRRFFQRSRAQNCWNMSEVFTQAGIHTAHRTAIIQETLGPLKLRSWFISEYVEADDLFRFLDKIENQDHAKRRYTRLKNDINQLFLRLTTHRLSHGDMKASNILVFNDQVYLIDLDAAHQHTLEAPFKRASRKDWARFMKNWQSHAKLHDLFAPLQQSLPSSKL